MAVEAAAERRDQHHRQDQHGRDPQQAVLSRGEGGAGDQQQGRETPGQIDPVRQAERHDHQTGADQRGDEDAGAHRELGIVAIQPGEIGFRCQQAQKQQQRAAQADGTRGRRDGEIGFGPGPNSARRGGASSLLQQPAAAQQNLIPGEQDAGEEQRDDVVEQAEDDDRADDLRRLQIRRQAEQHRGVEHADAARQVGGQTGGVGRHVNAQENQPGQAGCRRQQRVENGGGGGHVNGRQQHL